MKYPKRFGRNFEDFNELGDIHTVNPLTDQIVVKAKDHYLLYEGRTGGTLINEGWELIAIKDYKLNELLVEDFVQEADNA